MIVRKSLWACACALAVVSFAPSRGLAALIVTEGATWPASPAVQTYARTDANVTSERDVRYIRDLAQTFQVASAIQVDKIYVDVEEAVANREYTLRMFTVADVNAADPLIDPNNAGFTGTVLFSLTTTTSAGINTADGGNNPLLVLEFDLTGADEVMLSPSVGSAGYGFQILRTGDGRTNPDGTDPAGDSRAFKWHYNNNGNLFAGGRGYAIAGGGIDGQDDFLMAIVAVPEPSCVALAALGACGLLRSRRRDLAHLT